MLLHTCHGDDNLMVIQQALTETTVHILIIIADAKVALWLLVNKAALFE
jgi:hypothetical protein